jgi:hypothetical protein
MLEESTPQKERVKSAVKKDELGNQSPIINVMTDGLENFESDLISEDDTSEILA